MEQGQSTNGIVRKLTSLHSSNSARHKSKVVPNDQVRVADATITTTLDDAKENTTVKEGKLLPHTHTHICFCVARLALALPSFHFFAPSSTSFFIIFSSFLL